MAELRDLHEALLSLSQAGKSAKVSFYYLGEDGLKMFSGAIAVIDGHDCYIQFEQRTADEALAAIPGLRFAKITSLPSMVVAHEGDPVAIAEVLDRLDPAHQAVAEPEPEPEPPPAPAAAEPVAAAPERHQFYSHVALQKDALDLLEPIFGVGAAKKVEEFARQSPPVNHPREFLDRCRQHAAMMLGPRKAEELFQPIFDRLS